MYTVTTTADSGAGSLRQAVSDANGNAGADQIVFSGAGASGQIVLTGGELAISASDDLTITGPGSGALSVSGNDASRIFNITAGGPATIGISGLTLTHGLSSSGGGALSATGSAAVNLDDVKVTNSTSSAPGGGIYTSNGKLTLSHSTLSGNTGSSGGGLESIGTGAVVTDSSVTGNHATGSSYSRGGGLDFGGHTATVQRTTVSGNDATGTGGGIALNTKYGFSVQSSTVTGNTSDFGGGLSLAAGGPKYANGTVALADVTETTVAGNHGKHGGGVEVGTIGGRVRATITRSTISGNDGGTGSFGGGMLVDGSVGGSFDLVDSTISGNSADAGGGVSLGADGNFHLLSSYNGATGTIGFDNSTIAGNTAAHHGGGIYLSQYDSGSPPAKVSGNASLTSTIVADNTAAGAAQDLDRVDTSTAGGFDGAFSLIEAPGDAPLANDTDIIGADPQLGALGDHGGPTQTMLPSGTSPVIDQGLSPARLKVDQRNADRVVDTGIPNAPKGDGTDIGAVELAADQVVLPPPPPKATFDVTVRGVSISPGTPLLPAGTLPLDCQTTVVTMLSCNVELRSLAAVRSGRTRIPKGALLAEGSATSNAGAGRLSLKVQVTSDGAAVLKARPVGVDSLVTAQAATDASNALTKRGVVHLLAGPSVTLGLGTRSTRLATTVTKELDQLAKLIVDAKTITCTAYTDKGKGDVKLTKAQAKAACARLVKDGVKGTVTSSGKGHAKPVASGRTAKGRALNRRVVITFTL